LLTGGVALFPSTDPNAPPQPKSGGVIDSHIFVDADGQPFLFWKADTNGLWPRPLARLLREEPELIAAVVRARRGSPHRRLRRRGAALGERTPADRALLLMQPLIEAVLESWPRVQRSLRASGPRRDILDAMQTPVRAQRLAPDGASLIGEPTIVLTNDQRGKGH
jgi:hypothetical protein